MMMASMQKCVGVTKKCSDAEYIECNAEPPYTIGLNQRSKKQKHPSFHDEDDDGDADDDDSDDADDIALKWPQPPYKCGPNPPLEKSDFFRGRPPLELIYHANAETAAPNTSKEEKTQLGYPSFCDLHLFVWYFCSWGTPKETYLRNACIIVV